MPGIIPPGGAGGVGPSGNPQVTFVNEVAKQTGLDPRVVEAWTIAEGAYAPNGTGHYNFLNLRHYAPSDVGVVGQSGGGFDQFGSLDSAIASTVARIKQPFLARFLDPVIKKRGTPNEQLRAIAASGWDAGHYIGRYGGSSIVGGKLYSDFASKYGAAALGGKPETQPLPAAGGGASSDQTKLHVGNPLDWPGEITGWIESKVGYALVYGALVMFSIVLAIFGLLALLGIKPRTVATTAAASAARTGAMAAA